MTSPNSFEHQGIQIVCPRCQGPSLYASHNAWRPFCSERCKTGDLGAWANESYVVPAAPPSEDLEDSL